MFDLHTVHQKADYAISEDTLRQWSEGIGFGRKVAYDSDDLRRLDEDMAAIRDEFIFQYCNPYYTSTISSYIPQTVKTYLAPAVSYVANLVTNFLQTKSYWKESQKTVILTGGAPGAGKTLLLERIMKENTQPLPYLDPDAVFLKNLMKKTYQADLEKALEAAGDDEGKIKQARQEMYDKWRCASNYLTHYWIAFFIGQNKSFYFGTTASSPQMKDTFDYYKKRNYNIDLIYIAAPDQVRFDSITLRDKKFVQTTLEDIIEKGKMVWDRFTDTFLKATTMSLYFRDKADGEAFHVADWSQINPFKVLDQTHYSALIELQKEKAPGVTWPLPMPTHRTFD